jgi:hypothetical protein
MTSQFLVVIQTVSLRGTNPLGVPAPSLHVRLPLRPHRLIRDLRSGSAELPGSTNTVQNFTFLASLVNCSNLDPQSEIACVQKIPAVTLENAFSNYAISGAKPTIAFTPFPDNKASFGNFTDRAVRGLVATIVSHFVIFLRTSWYGG